MSLKSGKASTLALIVTSIVSIIITLGIVAIVLSYYGTEKVATEVSPFVEQTRNRLTEGVIPPNLKEEPKTEADEIMDAVASNQGGSVLIYSANPTKSEFLGRGILISSTGQIITDSSILDTDNASTTYTVTVPGTKDTFTATLVNYRDNLGLLKIDISTTQIAKFGQNMPVANDLVVAVTGDEKMRIGTGIVTKMSPSTITTNIFGTIAPGSILVSKSGFTIGLSTTKNQKAGEANFTILTKSIIGTLTGNIEA